jgi:hypothetical protein
MERVPDDVHALNRDAIWRRDLNCRSQISDRPIRDGYFLPCHWNNPDGSFPSFFSILLEQREAKIRFESIIVVIANGVFLDANYIHGVLHNEYV